MLHVFHARTLSVTNCGVAVGDVRTGRRHPAFTMLENEQGLDLNGDGGLQPRGELPVASG